MRPDDFHASNAFGEFLKEMALSRDGLPRRLWTAFSVHLVGRGFCRSLSYEAKRQANEFADYYFGFDHFEEISAGGAIDKIDKFNDETTLFAFRDLMLLREVVEAAVRRPMNFGASAC